MIYLIISGIDGSGKTTVINDLRERFSKEGFNVQYFWLRFNHYFAKLMHAFARIIGLSQKQNINGRSFWMHKFYKSKVFSWLYIRLTYIDTYLGKLKMKSTIKKNAGIIICDRWVNDVLIDLATKTRNRNFLSSSWYKRFQNMLPENSYQFIIFRDENKLLDCRNENREDPDFRFRLEMYSILKKKKEVTCIENNGSVRQATVEILNKLPEKYRLIN